MCECGPWQGVQGTTLCCASAAPGSGGSDGVARLTLRTLLTGLAHTKMPGCRWTRDTVQQPYTWPQSIPFLCSHLPKVCLQ